MGSPLKPDVSLYKIEFWRETTCVTASEIHREFRIVYTVGLEPELDFRYNNNIFILFININIRK